MEAVRGLSTMLAALLLATSLHAQSRPDFTGRWTLDPKATVTGLGPPAKELTIQQNDTTLTIEERSGDRVVTITYRLDGKRSSNISPVAPVSAADAHYTSRWKDSVLVTSITRSVGPRGKQVNLDYHEMRSLSDDGSMVVVTTIRGRPAGRKAVYWRLQRG